MQKSDPFAFMNESGESPSATVNGKVATVFGGSGFVGAYVVRRLAKQGWTVRVACRRPSRAKSLKTSGDVGQVIPIYAPVTDRAAVSGAVQGAELVINLAAVLYERGKQSFEALHIQGPALIAEACTSFGVERFVQMSSIGADLTSQSRYAQSRAAGEDATKERFPGVTILRSSIIAGAEDDFFNRFAAMARMAPFLPLIGGGKTRMQPVTIRNVTDAIIAAATKPGTSGKTFELAGPKTYSFKELMELTLAQIQRKKRLVTIPVAAASALAKVAQFLPSPPITPDQVISLGIDNVKDDKMPGLKDLGIVPDAIESILPSYLARYRPGGRFTVQHIGPQSQA